MIIEPIPAFNDNYIWLLRNPEGDAFVVDPGDAEPVLARLATENLRLKGILITHHHGDHTGGLARLKEQTGCAVWGPHNPAIKGIDHRVSEGDTVAALGEEFSVLEVPGHTLDHIAYVGSDSLFCGDTLFAGGCGRVFEGTFPMMRQSLNKLRDLPEHLNVFCAHEYTLANLAFASAADPYNSALSARVIRCQSLRDANTPTVPSSLAEEKTTNPFLRWDDPTLVMALSEQQRLPDASNDAVFTALRQWKDSF